MTVTGKNIDDWISSEQDVIYTVLDPGKPIEITGSIKYWILEAGDKLIVSPDKTVVLKRENGQPDRRGVFSRFASHLPCTISLSDGQAITGTLWLNQPTVECGIVKGATNVKFNVGSPSGNDIVNDGLVLGKS